MVHSKLRLSVVLFLVVLFAQGCVGDDLERGKAAHQKHDYATALQLLVPLAEQGNAEAQFDLGWMYTFGQGVELDYGKAIKLYRDAAAQGNSDACTALSHLYQDGHGVSKDEIEAERWRRKAKEPKNVRLIHALAEQGDARAQFELGKIYSKAAIFEDDHKEALYWIRKSAEQNLADAQVLLGSFYEAGQGTPSDYVEAEKWYRKAAEQGHAEGQINLGLLYEKGRGVPVDYVFADMWLILATTGEIETRGLATHYRDEVSAKMKPEQIAESEAKAKEWKKK